MGTNSLDATVCFGVGGCCDVSCWPCDEYNVAILQMPDTNEARLIHGPWTVVLHSFQATTRQCWLALLHPLVPCQHLLLVFIMQEIHQWFVAVISFAYFWIVICNVIVSMKTKSFIFCVFYHSRTTVVACFQLVWCSSVIIISCNIGCSDTFINGNWDCK